MRALIGYDEHGGIPVPVRPDVAEPPHWRLEAIAAVERPRHPDVCGCRIAFVLDQESSDLWVLDTDRGVQPERWTSDRGRYPYWDDAGPRWSPDGTRLAYSDAGWVLVTDGSVPQRICEGSDPRWIDDTRLVIGVERDERTQLAVVDVSERWPRRLHDAPGEIIGARVAPAGDRVVCVVCPFDDLNASRIVIVRLDGGPVTEVPGESAMHDLAPAWSPDGTAIVYASESSGWYELHRFDLSSSTSRRLTTAEADFTELAWSTHGLAAIRTRHGVSDLVLVDPDDGVVTMLAAGGVWASPAWCDDGTLVAAHDSPDVPPELVRVDRHGVTQVLLAPSPRAIALAPHVLPEHVWYPSDGVLIPGFLYRPPGATADRPCPVVVNPHGGPTSCYAAEWDGVAQWFVAKGYGWFAPNFRGSTGYGRDFERSNHHAWAVVDTADCLAAHAWLAGQDWVDARRIAIFGASYGSYMALCSAVDGDAYACAVAKYGDCDVLTSWAQGDREGRLDLERMMGTPAEFPDEYRVASPIHRIEQLRVPILVAHGELDIRVHPAQSAELVEALRRIGATFDYVTYRGEGHGFVHREPFLDFHRRLARFLDWYLGVAN